ncbi:ABC transporter ATP-binding protein/permease [Kaistia dalseonensis]|uniref:ATP-binding cassette subfamily B protein n=1 Tax=Kaistia dalseonensis TaxID=410840 RepID=A0ABU0H388_9HYPH|nr:ABC transporter ATP-binding protein/permease [Kaistia dalseonensis]MCX5493798.1 ABC transporter ATP-binding protein/permease [Kaistia dalseonensis]MDQ0436363.1 ATP-binding cassette subfamily B protein [Kaistia dalseonensis]
MSAPTSTAPANAASTSGTPKIPINPKAALQDEATAFSTVKRLWPYIWPRDRNDLKVRVVAALVVLVFAKVITVLIPFLYKWATNALVGPDALKEPATVSLILTVPVMLIIAWGFGRVLLTAFNQLRDALFARVSEYAIRKLGHRAFVHMHRLSLRFHLQRRTGGLSRTMDHGMKGVDAIVDHIILNTFPTLLEFILAAVVIAYQFDLAYLGVITVTIVAYVWFTVVASNWRIAIRRDMNASDTEANAKAVDSLLNYETVKYFGNEEMEARRYDQSLERYEEASIKTWTSLAWLNLGQTVIFTLGMTTCMVMSGMAIMRGTQSIGDFVMINALLIQLSFPLNFIGTIYRELKQGLADVEAMFQLLDVPEEVQDKPGAPALVVKEGAVRFEDVTFAYDPARAILKGISFEVPAGKTVAIVGPSGAGKSTISRLMFRFYDVTSGRITIDGVDIRDVQQKSVRAVIGMVPQDTVLFNETIAYNIRYGRPDATDAEMREAARMAQIGPFIETLPDGFDTEVGERGLKLSGGEKQRVAIARTILKAPPILVLDEATSALDTHTEREIQGALDRVSAGRTTLVIAHRLSTVVNADEIIVLEAGQIKERGRHDVLMAQGGLYASMWNRQREAAEAAERLRQVQETDTLGIVKRGPKAELEAIG